MKKIICDKRKGGNPLRSVVGAFCTSPGSVASGACCSENISHGRASTIISGSGRSPSVRRNVNMTGAGK